MFACLDSNLKQKWWIEVDQNCDWLIVDKKERNEEKWRNFEIDDVLL